jgi:hypothetical protein
MPISWESDPMDPFPKPRERRRPWGALLTAAGLLLIPPGALHAEEAASLPAHPLPAAVVDSLPMALDPDARQQLLTLGSCSSFFQEQPRADLCPSPDAAGDILRTLDAAHPNIGIQTLVAEPMPARLGARTDRGLRLYNLLHQFRTMEGIQYFSAGHGRMRVFCTASHVVKGPDDRAMLQDPQYRAIEAAHDLFVEQDDSTFGRTLYAVNVKGLKGDAIELTMSNVEQVRYGILPVLKPGALKLTLVVQPSADGRSLFFYGNVGVRAVRLFGMENRVRTSFCNRLIALYNWVAQQAALA